MADIKILLTCAKTGNADAFGELYGLYAGELFLYAYKILGNRENAEDAVSTATLNVYKSIAFVRNASSFKAYYFRALANTCHTMMKKDYVPTVNFEEYFNISSEEDLQTSSITKAVVAEALEKLSTDEKEIVILSVVSGFTSREIAEITGLTSGSVRSKLSRSLAKLRTELEND